MFLGYRTSGPITYCRHGSSVVCPSSVYNFISGSIFLKFCTHKLKHILRGCFFCFWKFSFLTKWRLFLCQNWHFWQFVVNFLKNCSVTFFSNFSYKLLIISSNCSINLVWLESLEVGHFDHFYWKKRPFFGYICCFLKTVLCKFLSNFSYKLLIMISNSSISFVPIESVQVGHFGPS